MKPSRLKLPALVIFTCWLCSSTCQALPRPAEFFPADTFFLANVNDFSRLEENFKKTDYYKLYKHPAMAPFFEHVREKWRHKMQETDNELAKAIFDTKLLPTGCLAAGVIAPGPAGLAANDREPGFVLVSQWGPGKDKIKQTIEKMVQTAVSEGAAQTRETYRSTTITTVIKKRPPLKVPDTSAWDTNDPETTFKEIERKPIKISYCFVDDTLVAATGVNTEALKFIIAHIQGSRTGSLSEDLNYSGTIQALGPARDIEAYLNMKRFIDESIGADTSGKAKTMVTNLGLDNLTGFGLSLGFAPKTPVNYHGACLLRIAGRKRGILKIIEPVSSKIDIPPFIDSETFSLSFLHLDFKTAYDELFKMLSSINPALAAPLTVPLLPAGPNGQPGLELRKDLIEYLSPQIVIAQSMKKPAQAQQDSASVLVAVAITDREAIEKTLSTWHSRTIAPSRDDLRRQLLGYNMYILDLTSLAGFMPFPWGPPGRIPMQDMTTTTPPQMPKIAFTITQTHLIFASEPAVEQAIRRLSAGQTAPVKQTKWLTLAASTIPTTVGYAGLTDTASYYQFLWQQLKESAEPGSTKFASPLAVMPGGLGKLVDFSLLPEFDAVRRLFGVSASYGISRADGLYFEFKDTNPSNVN